MEKKKDLWRRAFGDTEKYMDYYFSKKAPVSDSYEDIESGELASMAFFTPYSMMYRGRECTGVYIVGVATEEKYRSEHRMTRLLKAAIEKYRACGVPFVFLCPETPAVYKSLGFVPVYWRETIYIEEKYLRKENGFRVCKWRSLTGGERREAVRFANETLKKEAFDLYMIRSENYYDNVCAELQALDGELLVVWDDAGEINAVVNVIYEDERYQVTELIGTTAHGKEIIDALLIYMQTGRLQVDDSYFLQEVTGAGVKRKKQEKPYIMCRMLAEEPPVTRCYINDIT